MNAVAPGYIETAMTAILTDDQKNAITQHIPLARVGMDLDIAMPLPFLPRSRLGILPATLWM